MGFVDKFKEIFVAPADDFDDEFDDEFDEMEMEDDSLSEPTNGYSYTESSSTVNTAAKKPSKVVNIQAKSQLQVVLVKPERFEEASSIADHLNDKRTVVLNLEIADAAVSRRLIDFLSGVAYANNGQIKRVANSTFIITPYNVDVMGDLMEELEGSATYF